MKPYLKVNTDAIGWEKIQRKSILILTKGKAHQYFPCQIQRCFQAQLNAIIAEETNKPPDLCKKFYESSEYNSDSGI